MTRLFDPMSLKSKATFSQPASPEPASLPGMNSVPTALAQIAHRFGQCLDDRGATPRGVGWSSPQAQSLRFQALLQILRDHPAGQAFTAWDLGCGYGALARLLMEIPDRPLADYVGYDISQTMIDAANRHHAQNPRCHFARAALPRAAADYGFVSGTFNFRHTASEADWRRYVRASIAHLIGQSRKGVAINFLRRAAKPPHGRKRNMQGMFYSTVDDWLPFAQSQTSGTVEVLDDYLDDDFTLLIRHHP